MSVNFRNTRQNENTNDTTEESASRNTRSDFTGSFGFGITSPMAVESSGGEFFEKLFECVVNRIKKRSENARFENKYNVVKLLGHSLGLNYSGIAICETLGDVTSTHLLMIEKTGVYPTSIVENFGGIRYEITRTPADALDEDYVKKAKNVIAATLGVPVERVIVADGTLVPNEFDLNNEGQVASLLTNAFNAISVENCIRVKDYKGLNLAQILANNKNGAFYISTSFSGDRTCLLDQSGMPIRQNVCVQLTFKVNQQGSSKSLNMGSDSVEIVKTYGYVDFEFVGPTMANNMLTTQKFVPNFIVTHMESQLAPTPDILMLGIASLVSLSEDLNWMQSFRSVPSVKGEIDYNDIGALNIEGNIENSNTGFGKLYDTKQKTFTMVELNKFVQMLTRPGMLISIDVPKAGPETWFTSLFHYIKVRESAAAKKRLDDHVGHMTNGAFVPTPEVFNAVSNKIHGGFYRTKDGFEDVRQLSSYLAVANFVASTNQSPALITQYTNTLYNTQIPSELRAAERKKTIDEMSKNSAVYKQFYDRLTFNKQYLTNLVLALKASGFTPRFNNLGVTNEMFVRRSSVDYSNSVIAPDLRLMGQNDVYGNFTNPFQYTRSF